MDAHVLNLYAITNVDNLRARYRLIDIEGSFGDEDLADQNLSVLAKRVALDEKVPVALFRQSDKPILAVPANAYLAKREYQLTPDVVELRPRPEEHELCLGAMTPEMESVGLAFLSFHLRTPLFHDRNLWSSGPGTYFAKRPVNYRENRRDVDVYEGFSFRVVRVKGKLYVSIAITYKYSDCLWLLERNAPQDLPALKMRHMLYHTGHRWFPVQFLALTGNRIAEQSFVMDDGTKRTVFEHTHLVAGEQPPQWIQSLDPDYPAIGFQYPGSGKKHYGAAALCKLLLSNDDPAAKKLHRLSIVAPEDRFRKSGEILRKHLFGAKFEGIPLWFDQTPLAYEPKFFSVPLLCFGQGKILDASAVGLEKLGNARMGYLLDPQGGLAVHGPLGAQCLFLPQTLDRKIAQPFQESLENTVREFLHAPYKFQPVVYANDQKRTLREQVDAIVEAARQNGGLSGHGILILPENAAPDLHNYIKKKLHSQIQFQCVSAAKVRTFYKMMPANGKALYVVDPDKERNYTSYLRYTALGLLLVNRRWPWVLEQPTHYESYIGVDVLRNTAAFTFFYEGGRKCFVRLEESPQKEKVPRKKVAAVVYRYLKEDLKSFSRPLRSLVLRRDGRAFADEWLGFRDAVNKLIQEGVLPKEIRVGVVEIHKTFSPGLRLVAENGNGRLVNPRIGSWQELNHLEAILCTTGYPFRFEGTVKPLYVKVVRGNLDLAKIVEDTFRMSQLCWPVPNRCMRLPIDLKLCDDLLRATAADADEEEAIYGDYEPDVSDGPEMGISLQH